MLMLKMREVLVIAVLCLGSLLVMVDSAPVLVGGPQDIPNFANSVEIDDLANFAVNQYKARQDTNAVMSFSKVVAAKEQVVAGTMYYLTVEVNEGGAKKLYDAKVWVKPWEDYKELESFVPSSASEFTKADLGTKAGDCHPKETEIAT